MRRQGEAKTTPLEQNGAGSSAAAALVDKMDQLKERAGGGDEAALAELVRARYRAGAALIDAPSEPAPYPDPAHDLPDQVPGALPELTADELTPERLRGAVLRDGCVVIRELIARDRAADLNDQVERLYAQHGDLEASTADGGADYELFVPDAEHQLLERPWVRAAGGVWLVDAPRLMYEILDLYDRAGVSRVVSEYLGGPLVLSVNKSTLRRAEANKSNIDWHQDGAFMGDVRTLNVWLSLSDCGENAPGLLMVPRRIDEIVETGTPGARFDWSVSPSVAEAQAGSGGVIHPSFGPGDAVIFDNFFLHATWVHPDMPERRNAVEAWFFSPLAFPREYVPIAV